MSRTNPLSRRSRNKTFTGAEIAAFVGQKLAASKRAKPVKSRSDFDLNALRSIVKAPFIPPAAYSWSIEQIVNARDQQMTGRFRLPARLAESMGTDDAIFTARGVRLAPVQSLDVKIVEGSGTKSARIADEADALFGNKGVAVSSETVTTIRSHLTDHGIAFAAITWVPRGDGSRWDPMLTAWPIEFAWWNAAANCYYTQARHLDCEPPDPTSMMMSEPFGASTQEPIEHGNGRWVVFSKSEILPHRLDAALLPAALVWARHAFAMRDFSKSSASHGNAKVIGELPPGVGATDPDGKPTQEAAAMMVLLEAISSQDSPYGIQPSGGSVKIMANPSNLWEVFDKLSEKAEKAAARIYLGTDGVLGAQGGAPGVDISALLGVASSKIESDLAAIQRGLQSGLVCPWTSINFGDDRAAPERIYVYPDPDESRVREDFAKRNAAFNADIAAYKANGFTVDQRLVDKIAAAHGVPAPQLPSAPSSDPAASPQAT